MVISEVLVGGGGEGFAIVAPEYPKVENPLLLVPDPENKSMIKSGSLLEFCRIVVSRAGFLASIPGRAI